MKRIDKIVVVGFLATLSLFSCKQEMIDYIGSDGVYFSVQPATQTESGDPDLWPVVDSSYVQFAKTQEKDTIYNIKVKLLGYVKDYDRTFGLKVLPISTVVEGRDYDKLPESIIMPAGAAFVNIPVPLHRTEPMKEKELNLTLELVQSKDLYVPMQRYFTTSSQQSDTVTVNIHTVIINDKLYRPLTWVDYIGGAYSDAKMGLICELYNLTVDEFDSQKTMPPKRFKSIIYAFKNYLELRKKEGKTVYETDSKGNIIYITDVTGAKVPVEMKVGIVTIS